MRSLIFFFTWLLPLLIRAVFILPLLIRVVFIPLLRSQIFFPRLLGCSHYSVISLYFPPWPVFLISSFAHFRESKNCSWACSSPYTTIYSLHHTDTRSAPLVACWRSNFLYLHASVSTLLPLPLLFVSLISYNCTALLDRFTLVPAFVSCHSHPVGAGREGTVHSLVRAFCPELSATSHQECNNHRNVLVCSQSYLFNLE